MINSDSCACQEGCAVLCEFADLDGIVSGKTNQRNGTCIRSVSNLYITREAVRNDCTGKVGIISRIAIQGFLIRHLRMRSQDCTLECTSQNYLALCFIEIVQQGRNAGVIVLFAISVVGNGSAIDICKSVAIHNTHIRNMNVLRSSHTDYNIGIFPGFLSHTSAAALIVGLPVSNRIFQCRNVIKINIAVIIYNFPFFFCQMEINRILYCILRTVPDKMHLVAFICNGKFALNTAELFRTLDDGLKFFLKINKRILGNLINHWFSAGIFDSGLIANYKITILRIETILLLAILAFTFNVTDHCIIAHNCMCKMIIVQQIFQPYLIRKITQTNIIIPAG